MIETSCLENMILYTILQNIQKRWRNLVLETELISVIVPVYNCEKYLKECIDSIVGQTYRNLEIILVDDGSVDSSGIICDEYAQRDNRIKVIHKKNGGQQDARSAGIAISSGSFIGFVDSDDWIDPDMYEYLYKNIGTSDLVTSGLWRYDISGAKTKLIDALEAGIYDGQSKYFCENLIISAEDTGSGMVGGILNNVYNKLFKASIVKKCYPQVNVNIKNGEDLLFTITYILKCKKIIITHESFYHYRYDSSSMSHKKNLEYLTDLNQFYMSLDKAITGHIYEEILRDQLDRLLLYFVYTNTSSKMQMNTELCYPQYVFPKNSLLNGKNVVLFGSGKVGKSYFHDWKYRDSVHVVQWIDSVPPINEILGQKIYSAEEILQNGYDYVVCAVLDQERAEGMKRQLVGYGVKEDIILWEKPDNIFKDFLFNRVSSKIG